MENHCQLTQLTIYKCKLKLYHAKRKPYFTNIQNHSRLLWARAHLRWTEQWKSVLWSDESMFQIVFENHGRCVLWAKEDCPDCYQRKVQKPASVLVWGCVSAHGMGNLHNCEGTINAETFIQFLEQPSTSHPSNIFFRDIPAYFSKTVLSHILHVSQQRGFVVKQCRY